MIRVGTDLCEVVRIQSMLTRSPFVRAEIFARSEIRWCEKLRHPYQGYAACWAGKEACLKAFGFNILGYDLSAIEIEYPAKITIQDVALQRQITQFGREVEFSLSLTMDKNHSLAVVIVKSSQ